ncbi:MAG TPA: transketolase [Rhodothermales bacterium]|nr:transketolase [Rhodothermales bacterium]
MAETNVAREADRLQDMSLEERTINTIRFLSADAVQKAESGHPGLPMGAAPMAYVLWHRYLKHNPHHPKWIDRDRFVLSAGHGSMLLYSLLHLTGYDLSLDDIKQFRQWGSITPGHPENHLTPGIEVTTGPLGQGIAMSVGMAIAEQFLAARFNQPGFDVVDHHTYTICSDGDLMEGVSHEAASLAGHLRLGKLIWLYDDNHVSIDGNTEISFTDDTGKRFEAYGWQVLHVTDGNDLDAIDRAIQQARAETGRPSIIMVRTIIGFGAPHKQGTAVAHGEPLGEEELRAAKENLGWPADARFYVPEGVYDHMREAVEDGSRAEAEWDELMAQYTAAFPDKAKEFKDWQEGNLPEGWEEVIPTFEPGEKLATRASGGKVLGQLAPKVGFLIGGSADLTPSNKTDVKGRSDFQPDNYSGAYFRFGVREHGMAGACNGMSMHGGVRPYGGTFLIFSDYMRPSVRLAALMHAKTIFVFTHDSIGLGEDGPTHQPIEQLMSLRAIPNLTVFRPADANETAQVWRATMMHTDGPVAMALSRQNLPTLDRSKYASAEGVLKGAYILKDSEGTPDIILMATGSEVQHIVAADEMLVKEGVMVRLVSMPSWEFFEQQPESYRNEVLPPAVTKRISIEAGTTLGWERYVGLQGRAIGINHFGASAPADILMKEFGFTADHVVQQAHELLGR